MTKPVTPAEIAARLSEALARRDAHAAKCPVNAPHAPYYEICPRCHATQRDVCVAMVDADSALVDDVRAILMEKTDEAE